MLTIVRDRLTMATPMLLVWVNLPGPFADFQADRLGQEACFLRRLQHRTPHAIEQFAGWFYIKFQPNLPVCLNPLKIIRLEARTWTSYDEGLNLYSRLAGDVVPKTSLETWRLMQKRRFKLN